MEDVYRVNIWLNEDISLTWTGHFYNQKYYDPNLINVEMNRETEVEI